MNTITDDLNIIQKIMGSASILKESDIDEWMVPQLIRFYSQKISVLAVKSYGQAAQGPTVAHLAFKERSKTELRSALNTFIFKSEHWKSNRDLNAYLLTCLNRLSDRIKWDSDSVKKVNAPICPGCRHMGKREYLVLEEKLWRCNICTNELERLTDEINILKQKQDMASLDKENIALFESRIRLHKGFALHSRKGYRCLECERFMPESLNGPYGISCPYDDCLFFDKISKLELMVHPVGLTQRSMLSLQTPISNSDKSSKSEIQDVIMAENINPDVHLEVYENLEIELNMLNQVLEEQIQSIKRTNSAGTMMQKLLMHEAYKHMLNEFPEEIISYLVHRKQSSDFPIQCRIFQEYVRLMENALPYDIVRGNDVYSVMSLTDSNIHLFDGISEFNATIKNNFSIPNNTIETYTGGLKFKDYGPCFIGLLIDIVDKRTNKSLMDKVLNYSFVEIHMKPGEVNIGTPVLVKHFRILSHYELGALVYLQRARKRIVDSVYYRLNGHKRIAGDMYKESEKFDG